MKKLFIKLPVLFTLLLLISLFVSCDDDGAPDLSENPEVREDVYTQILNDEQLLTEFINEMGDNERAMEGFSNNRQISDRIYGEDHMNRMMRDNPGRRDTMMMGMMTGMERDTTLRPSPQLRERMLQHIQVLMQRDTTFAWELREMIRRQPPTGGAEAGTVR